MLDFSVHDLLKDTILDCLSNEPSPTFFVYEDVASQLNDLAFSFDQFTSAVACLAESKTVIINDNDGVIELTLPETKPVSRLDVN